MDTLTPAQATELVSRIGAKKAQAKYVKVAVSSFLSGPLLGFGCSLLVATNASPWYIENAPGLLRTIGGLVFPVGLTMIMLTGSELFTSNVMYMTTALLHRRVSAGNLLISWVISYFGNLLGMITFVALIAGYGGVFHEPVLRKTAISLAMKKAVYPAWHQIFLKAIGANWLVCFAMFGSIMSREAISKMFILWMPVTCFAALGLDHVIANMFYIPLGIWVGAPISVGYYIWKSMIPALLGNIVGGGLFVGTAYWYLYICGEEQDILLD
ncbi:Formate/nitrite transporter, partial [Microthyrium microscopicum]